MEQVVSVVPAHTCAHLMLGVILSRACMQSGFCWGECQGVPWFCSTGGGDLGV